MFLISISTGNMAIKYKCINCNIVLSGEGASRHYLANPTHKLEKLPPQIKPPKKNISY